MEISMSYSIYYDRAYIRVGEDFIPLVNSGSNNCFEISWNGREIAEKNWGVLNWHRRNRVLFSLAEICEIAREYDEYNKESGMIFKTRNTCFASKEFERWVINGVKSAYTVEEYMSFGNCVYFVDCSQRDADERPIRTQVMTTDELLDILGKAPADGNSEVNVEFGYNREVNRPVKPRASGASLNPDTLAEYYVLAGSLKNSIRDERIYFSQITRKRFLYTTDEKAKGIKAFKSERDAAKYLEKYESRLRDIVSFAPLRVVNTVKDAA